MDLEKEDWVDNQNSNYMDIEGKHIYSRNIHRCIHTCTVHTHKQTYLIAFVSSITEPEEEPGLCKKAVMCFCGLEQKKAPQLSPEEQAELQKKLTDTTELPLWRNVVNANAIILLCVAVFFHGYYG